ncbi:LUC7-domain-containing protein [Xylariaceae sp. FL0804]|nr:LUC7-domain-containing protein [Xylariaceae sp. FL0804]
MAAEQRKLLEQLMGGPQTSRAAQLSLTDAKVCRSFLVGTCPHDLFTNTKQDLGPCPRVHAEALKAEYEGLPEGARQRHGFEQDYLRDLHKYIDECNRRIDTAQRRLEKTPDEIRQTNVLLRAIADLGATVDDGLAEVQVLALDLGDVARACDDFFRVRQAAQARQDRERELKALSDTSGPSGHQKLQVCDVCGAYLSRLDNDRRLADHFYGKMHLGYAQMRKTYESLSREVRGGGGGGGGRSGRPPLDEPMRGDDYGDGWRGPRGPRRGGGGGGGGGGGRSGGRNRSGW